MSHQNPTDKELIELAAKAAGHEGKWQRNTDFIEECYYFEIPYNNQGVMTGFEWNPLREAGDALRLAVKLQLEIRPGPGAVSVSNVCYGDPLSFVWSMEMQGKAKLAEATQSRQIQIEQARSEREAAVLRAEAIAIVGKAAKDFPEYRLQEFLGAFAEALKEGNINQIMYVPTEANIPITEATRIRQAGVE